jgi:hypothetical protein
MKSKKVTFKRSAVGTCLYWLQFIPALPVLLVASLLWIIGESTCQGWSSYRRWFLSKFTTKIAE